MAISRKNVTEIAITGHGPSVLLRMTGDTFKIHGLDGFDEGVAGNGDLARIIAAEMAAHFGPVDSINGKVSDVVGILPSATEFTKQLTYPIEKRTK